MLEQVSGLSVNLELILVAEEIGIKALLRHYRHCNTTDYVIRVVKCFVPIEAYDDGRCPLPLFSAEAVALALLRVFLPWTKSKA